jgi:hypothetical protein
MAKISGMRSKSVMTIAGALLLILAVFVSGGDKA